MRKFVKFSTVLVAAFAMATAGCDSDGGEGTTGGSGGAGTDAVNSDEGGGGGGAPGDAGTGNSGNTGGPDVTTDEGGEPDTGPDAEEDIPEVDPCEGVTCDSPPDDTACDGNAVVGYVSAGTCVDGGCVYEWDVAANGTDCGDDVCIDGECVTPAEDYTFDAAASFMTGLQVGGTDGADDCCFDFDGDGEMDNALGGLVGSLAPLLGADLNITELISEAIVDGDLVVLLEYKNLDSDTDDADMQMYGFLGAYDVDNGTTFTEAITGTGDFLVSESSFKFDESGNNTWIPQINFEDATIAGGVMVAGPSLFKIAIPLGEVLLSLDISGTQIEGDVAYGANGVGLDINTGMLGGYVQMEDIYGALNAYFDTNCTCLGLDGPLVTYIDENTKAQCASKPPTSTCSDDPDTEICDTIAGFCGLALGFIKPDIDSDDTGVPDSISIGAWVEAVSANIVGMEVEL